MSREGTDGTDDTDGTVIRVLLADDHAAIRAGLRLLLSAESGLEVVGEAADGAVAVAQARALRPDVVLMDVRMPGTDGIEATARIVAEGTAQVLVLTSFEVDDYVRGSLRAGAAGYLLKSVGAEQLADAIRRVAAGEAVLAPEVTRTVIAAFTAQGTPPSPAPLPPDLTERESEILRALAEGMSNADLARHFTISEATVKTHVSRVLGKLGCTSRVQAAIRAREAGLV